MSENCRTESIAWEDHGRKDPFLKATDLPQPVLRAWPRLIAVATANGRVEQPAESAASPAAARSPSHPPKKKQKAKGEERMENDGGRGYASNALVPSALNKIRSPFVLCFFCCDVRCKSLSQSIKQQNKLNISLADPQRRKRPNSFLMMKIIALPARVMCARNNKDSPPASAVILLFFFFSNFHTAPKFEICHFSKNFLLCFPLSLFPFQTPLPSPLDHSSPSSLSWQSS